MKKTIDLQSALMREAVAPNSVQNSWEYSFRAADQLDGEKDTAEGWQIVSSRTTPDDRLVYLMKRARR